MGVTYEDSVADARVVAAKMAGLRIFADRERKMNLALAVAGGAALVVSQFTLYGDVGKGHRASFVRVARPEPAERLVDEMVAAL